MDENSIFFALLKEAVHGDSVAFDKEAFTEELIKRLYAMSKKQDVAQLIGYALIKNRLIEKTSEYYKRFREVQIAALYRTEKLEEGLAEISETLKKAEISFLPLKGSEVRKHYPEKWMRTSCDIDVLVEKSTLENAIERLVNAGWILEKDKNFHDVSLRREDGLHLELHYTGSMDILMDELWANRIEEGFRCHLTNEFLMYHLYCHMAYNFVRGGCGVRSVLDIWVLKDKLNIDEKILSELLENAQLTEFRNTMEELIDVWFNGREHTEITKSIEDFIFKGGIYGSNSNKTVISQARAGGKVKNFISRIFMPADKLKKTFPIIGKHRWLTPFFWVVRPIKMLAEGRLKRTVAELKYTNENTEDDIKEAQRFLEALGLNDNTRVIK